MLDWTNLSTHGKRLNRLIRLLEKRLKKTNDDDTFIRYSNSIGVLTEKLVNIARLELGIKEVYQKSEMYAR